MATSMKAAMSISKAISVFKNKHSCEMVDRHVRAVKRAAATNQNGFLLKDLSGLHELLSIMSRQLHAHPLYQGPLSLLIRICGKPFLKEKMSDESTYAPNVLQILTLLGQIAVHSNDSIRIVVAQSLSSFYTEEPNDAFLEGLQITKLTYNAALLEKSAVAKPLIETLGLIKDLETRLEVLHSIQLFSTSATNCNHMLSVGLGQHMCQIIAVPDSDPNDRLAFIGTDILWNLLENGSQVQVREQLSSIEFLSTLRKVVQRLVTASTGGIQSKQLRNDVLMICLLLAQICPNAPFVESGFFGDLCTYATIGEETESRHHLQSLTDSTKHFKLSNDHEDFELKKSLLCILTSLGSEPAAVRVMACKRTLRPLLSFVIHNDKASGGWNPAQFEELQLLALSCLCSLAPLLSADYMTCHGNTRILLLMEWCTTPEKHFKGHGNSFHGEGGRGSKIAQLRHCLRLLLSMCSYRDDTIIQDLHEQGAIPILISILKDFRNVPEVDVDHPVLLEMQADIMLILSCICEMDMHRKELFGGFDGIKVVGNYLKGDTAKFESGLGHSRLLLSAIDCVWCTVVGNPVVEDIFLASEGIFILLDLLKACPLNMQNLLLLVLADLCENPKAIPHVAAWKTPDGYSTWSLLARLWRAEEWDMGVPRACMATLAGTSLPLIGMEQNACGMPPIPTECPSAAITDVTENMRAKIYAIYCKMGFQYTSEELCPEDKITICIIKSYLDFKAGEVWYEVAGELAQEGLRPVTPDQECLTDILHTHEGKAELVLKRQHEIIDEYQRTEERKEAQFYDKINWYHHANEIAKQEFKNFVERTSNYGALKLAKAKQLNALDASRTSGVAIGDRFHSQDQKGLNTTTMCGRHVSIATTPLKLLVVPVVPPSLTDHSTTT